MMSSTRERMYEREKPSSAPLKKMFSRPESSASNPVPNSITGATVPLRMATPTDGGTMPAATRRSVDLPAPFAPMMPTASPCRMVRETSCRL